MRGLNVDVILFDQILHAFCYNYASQWRRLDPLSYKFVLAILSKV